MMFISRGRDWSGDNHVDTEARRKLQTQDARYKTQDDVILDF